MPELYDDKSGLQTSQASLNKKSEFIALH